jgi:hypothetical protein
MPSVNTMTTFGTLARSPRTYWNTLFKLNYINCTRLPAIHLPVRVAVQDQSLCVRCANRFGLLRLEYIYLLNNVIIYSLFYLAPAPVFDTYLNGIQCLAFL